MPFVAPILAAAIGVGAIGQALIGAALSFAMAAAARALGPKPRELEQSGRGMRLNLRLDPNAPREIVVGEAAVAGTLVYHHVFGPNGNDTIDLVYALSDCPCDSLQAIYVNGKEVAWNSVLGTVTEFPGMILKFYAGDADQTASADLIAMSGGAWTTDHRGAGICYVHARITFDQNLYQSGLPRFLFVIRGAKLYDWRLDDTNGGEGDHRWGTPSTYEWTANPVVILYNWRRGIFVDGERVAGMNTPAVAMPVDVWTAAANACDETVGVLPFGSETRYEAHGVIASRQTHRDVITDLLTAMAGREIDTGGTLVPLPGVAQSSVMTFTDDDIMSDGDVQIIAKRPRSQLINAVFGSYHSPDHVYESIAAPPRISPADELADGGIRLEEHYALDMVTSASQAQRILEIMRRRGRQQAEVRLKLRPRYAVLEAGDWVTWNSDRYGYSGATFEVVGATVGPDWSVTLTLRQIAASVFSWVAADDELDPAAPAEVTPGAPTLNEVPDFELSPVVVESGDTQRPALRATWGAITDRTVVRIVIQYRQVGDAGALEHTVLDASAGQATWLNGVLGGATYEARALPVTQPERAVEWTSWIEADDVTDTVVIDAVAPETIGSAELDAQTRFELSLTTALEEVEGSSAQRSEDAYEWAQRAGEEAIRALIASHTVAEDGRALSEAEIQSNIDAFEWAQRAGEEAIRAMMEAYGAKALVRTETIERTTETSALAAQITTATTTLAGHTTSITELLQSVDGINARWGVAINVDGQVVGLVQLDGDADESTFTVVADTFQVAQPDDDDGDPVPVFTIANVGGVAKLVLRGDMLSDGTITAPKINVSELSAIVANLGEITAGYMRSSAVNGSGFPKFELDLDEPYLIMRA